MLKVKVPFVGLEQVSIVKELFVLSISEMFGQIVIAVFTFVETLFWLIIGASFIGFTVIDTVAVSHKIGFPLSQITYSKTSEPK